jgi:hypothetical protein
MNDGASSCRDVDHPPRHRGFRECGEVFRQHAVASSGCFRVARDDIGTSRAYIGAMKERTIHTNTRVPHAANRHSQSAAARVARMFLDIPAAAGLAGLSLRQFRRAIENDRIPVIEIGRKFFILSRDFEQWETLRRSRR